MSDEATNTPAAPAERPNVTVREDFGEGTVVSRSRDGEFGSYEAGGMVSSEDEPDADQLDADVEDGLKEEPEAAGSETPEDKPTEEDSGKKPESVKIDLPDFDPENTEVADQYRAKYLSEDGKGLNFEAFNESFYANLQAGLVDINPQERAFVKAEMGLSDAAIDTYLGGLTKQVTELQAAQDAVIFTAYGSGTADKEGFEAAMAWAVGEGGYTQAQKDRYNAALEASAKGDNSLMEEQVELLKVRFTSSGKAPVAATPKETPKKRRDVSPAASATGGTTAAESAGIEPYQDLDAWRKDQAAAHNSGDRKKMQEVSARFKASPKLWRGKA